MIYCPVVPSVAGLLPSGPMVKAYKAKRDIFQKSRRRFPDFRAIPEIGSNTHVKPALKT